MYGTVISWSELRPKRIDQKLNRNEMSKNQQHVERNDKQIVVSGEAFAGEMTRSENSRISRSYPSSLG